MGNLSIRCQMGRSMMLRYLLSANGVHSKTPRAGVRTSSRRSSASMSCSWLFLGGLVSTRAHLRFTNRRTACDTRLLPVEHVSANGNRCLIRLSQPRGPLQPALGLAGWLLQNFLQLRGVVNLLASRIDLGFLALCIFIAACALTIGWRRRKTWRIMAAIFVTVLAFVVDRLTPIPAPTLRQHDVEKQIVLEQVPANGQAQAKAQKQNGAAKEGISPRSYIVFDGTMRFGEKRDHAGHLLPDQNFQVGDRLFFNFYVKATGPNPVEKLGVARWLYLEPDFKAETQKQMIADFKKRLAQERKEHLVKAEPFTLMPGDNRWDTVYAWTEDKQYRLVTQPDLDALRDGTRGRVRLRHPSAEHDAGRRRAR